MSTTIPPVDPTTSPGTPSIEPLRSWPTSSASRLLEAARAASVLSALDQQFATRVAGVYGEQSTGVIWALALACRQEAAGHVCADLQRLSVDGLSAETGEQGIAFSALAANETVEQWLDELRENALVEDVSRTMTLGADPRPLVLDDKGRVYLRRSYQRQVELAELIRVRTGSPDLEVDWEKANAGMTRLLPPGGDEDRAPRLAIETALARPLAIVSGGPGTGKTTMVARLIALLIEQAWAKGIEPPRVRLLAPTGKAAAAMQSSFFHQRETLDLSDEVRAAMDVGAETVHSALYPQTRRDAFGRARAWSLDSDIIVVDEASMVDLEMMTRLFRACRSADRIVLLGDPSQLASVDSGAVLAELCEPPETATREASTRHAKGLPDSLVRLRTSHRFTESGGIDRLAEAIRQGDGDAVIEILDDPDHPEVERFPIDSIAGVRAQLSATSRSMFLEIEEAGAPTEKLDRMLRYRVLCAHRRGPLGARALSSILDHTGASLRHANLRSGWWSGRMLLVTQNAPDQNLWNGDVGLVEETPSGLRAIFPDGSGGVRALSAGRLPAHESAIAMSVHKSQGSEFEVVDLVLGDVMSRIMTRELIYTGVTRARSQLRIHASESVLRDAVARRVSRDSGLGERLWAD